MKSIRKEISPNFEPRSRTLLCRRAGPKTKLEVIGPLMRVYIQHSKDFPNVNKNPTRCNSMQIFIYYKVTLHDRPDQATLEGSSCTSIMTCTGGCGYSS